MSDNFDWLSAIKRQGPAIPRSVRDIVTRADEVFRRARQEPSAINELEDLSTEVALSLLETLPLSLGTYGAILERALVLATKNDEALERCFAIFDKLSRIGFSSPVAKSRVVVVLLMFLERKLPADELKPLVYAMMSELEACRIGCEENASALKTFLHEPPGDSPKTG